jgi:hypothetical protein
MRDENTTEDRTMFRITGGKGFGIQFDNGYSVSVQFGPGNYCSNYDRDFEDSAECGKEGSRDSECAVFNTNGDFVRPPEWTDDINGRMNANEILDVMNWAAKQ